ncbi:MAG TPA: biopolymer transporter ExbB [Verrucomicrobiales bacterium]|nr:biopolymer transporter ExbB [Verrucomicrobiales bacterium]
MSVFIPILAASDLAYVWSKASPEGKVILVLLLVFSIVAWSTMVSKGLQMRRAKSLNRFFDAEYRQCKTVLAIFDRRIQVDGCPLFSVYHQGCLETDARLKKGGAGGRKQFISLKSVEHIKRVLENAVAREAIKLESGLILLAIAVSGAPFLGLLGTVWGVMTTFARVGQEGSADLATMAPGVSAALVTTVAGLLVAIPSMFFYNYLVHTLRVVTVELDNFAQELMSRIETEFMRDDEVID